MVVSAVALVSQGKGVSHPSNSCGHRTKTTLQHHMGKDYHIQATMVGILLNSNVYNELVWRRFWSCFGHVETKLVIITVEGIIGYKRTCGGGCCTRQQHLH